MQISLLTNGLQPEKMIENVDVFAEKLLVLAEDIGISLSGLTADHIALRINDSELAKQAHTAWLKYGEQISCAQINGRPIIVVRFYEPIRVKSWQIECLELPYPAEGKRYPEEGWEHIEFVIPSTAESAEGYLDSLKKQFPLMAERWSGLADKGIKTKLSSPKGEGERLPNPTVAFKRDGVCIKLHPHTLKKVVESERAEEDR